MWAPRVISWFINPINQSYLRIMNHSEIGILRPPTDRVFVATGPHDLYVFFSGTAFGKAREITITAFVLLKSWLPGLLKWPFIVDLSIGKWGLWDL